MSPFLLRSKDGNGKFEIWDFFLSTPLSVISCIGDLHIMYLQITNYTITNTFAYNSISQYIKLLGQILQQTNEFFERKWVFFCSIFPKKHTIWVFFGCWNRKFCLTYISNVKLRAPLGIKLNLT